jgi:hypothetical protein
LPHGAAHDLQDIRGGQTAQHQVNGDADKEQHQRHQARSAHNPNMRPPTTISSPCNV